MESLGLTQKDVQYRNKWIRRIKGQPANPGSPGKMAVKTEKGDRGETERIYSIVVFRVWTFFTTWHVTDSHYKVQ